MKHVELRGAKVPAIGLGTWQMKDDTCRRAVERGLALGYRHIDTAEMYGNEEEIGEKVQASGVPRDELWITTKVWPDHLRRDDLHRATEASLRKLCTDYVDLLLIHWPNPAIPLAETLEAMQQLQEQGQVRFIGVSNFPSKLVDEALRIAPIFANQVEHHPYLGQKRLKAQAQEHGLMLTAYCPLARGRVSEDETLRAIGETHGKTAAQVALRWMIQHEHVSAVPKASSEDHLQSNFDVFDFALSSEEMQRIDGLDRGERLIDPDFGPQWDPD